MTMGRLVEDVLNRMTRARGCLIAVGAILALVAVMVPAAPTADAQAGGVRWSADFKVEDATGFECTPNGTITDSNIAQVNGSYCRPDGFGPINGLALCQQVSSDFSVTYAYGPATGNCYRVIFNGGATSCQAPSVLDTDLVRAPTGEPIVARACGTQILAPYCFGKFVTIDMNIAGVSGTGTAGDDVILGTNGADSISGLGGNDTICAEAGDDQVDGGIGLDFIFGGDGNDVMVGGDGNDRIRGQAGVDQISGNAGNDFLYGGIEGDTINGNEGNDTINGGNGDDQLNGNNGNDTINGGRADDTMSGGLGNDTCTGNRQNTADTADATCETIFGVP